jgi:hypothetical protein
MIPAFELSWPLAGQPVITRREIGLVRREIANERRRIVPTRARIAGRPASIFSAHRTAA